MTPTWPAILHFAYSAELVYLADEQALYAILQQPNHWHDEDRVIDAQGVVFRILKEGALPALTSKGVVLPLATLVDLLQAHLADQGQCCVAKAGASSIADVLQQLASMANESQ